MWNLQLARLRAISLSNPLLISMGELLTGDVETDDKLKRRASAL